MPKAKRSGPKSSPDKRRAVDDNEENEDISLEGDGPRQEQMDQNGVGEVVTDDSKGTAAEESLINPTTEFPEDHEAEHSYGPGGTCSEPVELEPGIILFRPRAVTTVQEAASLLFSYKSADEICQMLPQKCPYREGTFLISLKNYNEKDLRVDGYGVWGNVHIRKIYFKKEGDVLQSISRTDQQSGLFYDFCVKCYDYHHKQTREPGATGSFYKKIFIAVDKHNDPASNFGVVSYRWVGTPFPIALYPHGRAKKPEALSKPYRRTLPSARERLVAVARTLPPADAFRFLEEQGEPPRDMNAVLNARYKAKRLDLSGSPFSSTAPVFRPAGAAGRDSFFEPKILGHSTPGLGEAEMRRLAYAKRKKLEVETQVLELQREKLSYEVKILRHEFYNHPAAEDERLEVINQQSMNHHRSSPSNKAEDPMIDVRDIN